MSRNRKERRDEMRGTRVVKRITVEATFEPNNPPTLNIQCDNLPTAIVIQTLRAAADGMEWKVEGQRVRNAIPDAPVMPTAPIPVIVRGNEILDHFQPDPNNPATPMAVTDCQ